VTERKNTTRTNRYRRSSKVSTALAVGTGTSWLAKPFRVRYRRSWTPPTGITSRETRVTSTHDGQIGNFYFWYESIDFSPAVRRSKYRNRLTHNRADGGDDTRCDDQKNECRSRTVLHAKTPRKSARTYGTAAAAAKEKTSRTDGRRDKRRTNTDSALPNAGGRPRSLAAAASPVQPPRGADPDDGRAATPNGKRRHWENTIILLLSSRLVAPAIFCAVFFIFHQSWIIKICVNATNDNNIITYAFIQLGFWY